VQSPRIPIWIGGSAQRRGVVRRAARWDGIAPYKLPETGAWEDFTPEDVRALRAAIEHRRAAPVPFDIAILGPRDRALIAAMAEAGATRWMQAVPAAPFAEMRAAFAQGPPRAG
jgi:hypothetical protein